MSIRVSIDDALARFEAGAQLVDVRELDEWNAGHAPEAIHLPMARVLLEVGLLDPARQVLVICRSGNRSLTGAAQLREAGLDAVSVDGGMGAWQLAGRPVVRDTGEPGTVI